MTDTKTGVASAALSGLLATVGTMVHSLRKEKGMTLAQLAETSGLSPAIVSQIERGKANPSFTTLAQLAHGLEIPVGRFFFGHDEPVSPVVRGTDRRNLQGVTRESVGEAAHELLTPDQNGLLEAQWIVSPPGHDTSATPFHHGGEEFGIVISGKIDVYLDGERHTVEAGDSMTFASTIPHWYINRYEEPCVAVWVSTPPAR
ncbi:helix-turn-helix domain-containing protein [Cryobacterium psychrophilum]|uniref:Cupin domain-containing protein n=1 Tax=Cryobacterium psychrophilum TaxID=41988 RepID=A0A4Y8KK64_9MICO|nr:cupin domain-containing protein [Cryobacterium psychrophilum]TDW29830.1 XRE family transcriptional regulator [Cryobacterium psychrophilum]TFD76784.1 cupin domain-containing protein [Cryobacterium psychrophilum]